MDQDEAPKQNKSEKIDEIFCDTRLKTDMVLELLAGKLEKEIDRLDLSKPEDLDRCDRLIQSLEKVIFLGQMNKAKVRDLIHLAPKKYHRVLSDEELRKQLKPLRDEVNFPKRGPKGPREDVSGGDEP